MFSISSLRYSVVLGIGLLCLTACSDVRNSIREKYTGERVGAPVAGARRTPVLNPHERAKTPPAPPAATSATTAPPIVPLPPNTSVVETPRPKLPGRKPFAGSGAAMEPVAPVTLTPQAAPDGVVPAPPPVKETPPAHNMTPEENGVIVPEPDQKVEDRDPNALPHLADVPKMPQALQQFKERKHLDAMFLENAHEDAQQQKHLLDAEPSELLGPSTRAPLFPSTRAG